jgi:preprotein translocase subunit SecA
MAGRGTDIRLGGREEADRDAVVALGGLYVIGTDKHESRRVDQQLRGRAGRQGDPGDSRFFVSLEDDLLVRYGIRNLIPERFFPERQENPVDSPIVRREVARAQRIIEGQNYEIRRTLSKYAAPLEEQRRALHERREGMLLDTADPDVWQRDDERYAALVAAAGADAARRAERTVTVHAIDQGWRDHLAFVADLREGIHLVRLGGGDPLSRFGVLSAEAFQKMEEGIDRAILDYLARVDVRDGTIDLTRLGIRGPSSTWTYLVNDDPFRHQIGLQLLGMGGTTFATAAAMVSMPLFLLMGVVTRYFGKKERRV